MGTYRWGRLLQRQALDVLVDLVQDGGHASRLDVHLGVDVAPFVIHDSADNQDRLPSAVVLDLGLHRFD